MTVVPVSKIGPSVHHLWVIPSHILLGIPSHILLGILFIPSHIQQNTVDMMVYHFWDSVIKDMVVSIFINLSLRSFTLGETNCHVISSPIERTTRWAVKPPATAMLMSLELQWWLTSWLETLCETFWIPDSQKLREIIYTCYLSCCILE